MKKDEYAKLEKLGGDPIVKANGSWWYKVRPLFYRPMFPFETFYTNKTKKYFKKVTGFQHIVEHNNFNNSYLNLVIFDRLKQYKTATLSKDKQRKLKRAIKNNLTVSRITNAKDFTAKAYPVYLSFHKRTKFKFRKDRIIKDKFAQWSNELFSFPSLEILGVFSGETLLSFEISSLINNVLILISTINSDIGLKLNAPDLMLHYCREKIADRKDIKMIYGGILQQNEGINKFKIERGARITSSPAYLHVHPTILWIIKRINLKIYQRLIGFDKEQISKKHSSF